MLTPTMRVRLVGSDEGDDSTEDFGDVQLVDVARTELNERRCFDLLLCEDTTAAIAKFVAEGGRQSINLILTLDDVEHAVEFMVRQDEGRR